MPETAEEYLVEALSQDPTHVPVDAVAAGPVQAARRLAEGRPADGARRGSTPPTRWRRPACCTRPARSTRRSWATRTRRPSCSRRILQLDPEHVEAAEPLSRALLQARGVGAAGAGPGDAGPQGRAPTQPRADPAAPPAGQGRRPAGRQREGAQALQAVLRLRLHLPAHLARPGGPAVPARALGRRLPALPDHPGPPPRGPEGRRHRRDLLTASVDQAEDRASGPRPSTCSRRRWRSSRATGRPWRR